MTTTVNGIMFAKEKKLVELEQIQKEVEQELQKQMSLNNELRKKQNQLQKQLTSLQMRHNMSEVEIIQQQRKQFDTGDKLQRMEQRLLLTQQLYGQTLTQMRKIQLNLQQKTQQLKEKQLLLRRLEKESKANDKSIRQDGRIRHDRQKYATMLRKHSQQLRILEDKLSAKERFLKVMERKKEKEEQQENSNRKINKNDSVDYRSQDNFKKVIDSVDKLKHDKMKNYEKLVRQKNAVLLRAKSQQHY